MRKSTPKGFYGEWRDERGFPPAGIVLADFQTIYVPIPKVANTSLKGALATALGLAAVDSANLAAVVHSDIQWQWTECASVPSRYADWFVFAFVRNPWDRLLSCYLSKVHPDRLDDPVLQLGVEPEFWKYGDVFHGKMSFKDFVRATAAISDEHADIHFASQHLHVTDASGNLLADFLGRFESLENDFDNVCARIGLRATLPHLLGTEHGEYRDYYTRETQELVADRWGHDVELFGYLF